MPEKGINAKARGRSDLPVGRLAEGSDGSALGSGYLERPTGTCEPIFSVGCTVGSLGSMNVVVLVLWSRKNT